MTVAAKLALIAPDYAGLSNLADYIELAEDAVASDMCQRDLAVAYMTAHIIAMAERGGKGSGAVTSKGEGGLSIGYSGSQSQSLLSSTAYGQEFERIMRACGRKGGFVMRTF